MAFVCGSVYVWITLMKDLNENECTYFLFLGLLPHALNDPGSGLINVAKFLVMWVHNAQVVT